MDELQPGDPPVAGPYRLIGRLGSGGMGRVFLGQSPGGRLVAVKVIRSELATDPEFRARFAREVAAARTVSGLFTAQVANADPDAVVPWLATAYVAGPSLAQAVTAHGPLPVPSVRALAAALAEALTAIHAAGIVHRDLKPTNVLLAQDGPRVIDFGISRAAEASALTGTGLVVGSPGFMSPEQAHGGEIGPPSDVFSLGAVIAFAATGEGPFGGGSVPALLYRVVHNQPEISGVPGPVRSIVERCLAKDPDQRPTSGQILAELGSPSAETEWLPRAVAEAYPAYLAPDAAPGLIASAPARPGTEIAGGPALTADDHTQTAAAGNAAAGPSVTGGPGSGDGLNQAPDFNPPPGQEATRLPRPASTASLQPAGSGLSARRHTASRRAWPVAAIVAAAVVAAATVALARGGIGQAQRQQTGNLAKNTAPLSSAAGMSGSGAGTQTVSSSPGAGGGNTGSRTGSSGGSQPGSGVSSQGAVSAPAPAVPQIVQVSTYQEGVLVYFSVRYSDPGNNAQGFGFVGVNGAGWGEENHPFSSPSYGRVSPGRVDYPFNHGCGTSSQIQSDVQVWIYDTAGTRSQAVTIHLACTNPLVPVITGASTYTQGSLVYFSVSYSDPGNDAQGFGFIGANGAGWAQETHPFSSPSFGRVGPGRIDYPFNLACGTAGQYQSDVKVWIYDTVGDRSQPVIVHLACS